MEDTRLHFERYTALIPDEKGDILHSVQRALRVLSLIAEHPQGLSARQISRALNLNISTCYHVLNTLAVAGYVDRQPQQQVYILGPQIPFLNNAFVQGLSRKETLFPNEDPLQVYGLSTALLVEKLRAILFRLTEKTQEPSYLGYWRYGEFVLLTIVEAPQAPKVEQLYVGYQGPAHCHALGKVLLAYSDPVFMSRYLDMHPLALFAPNTIIQRQHFEDELNSIVRQGYSIDKEEFSTNTCCIAAPIFAPRGEVIAAIAISFSSETFTKRIEWLITQVIQSANYARAELRISTTR